MDFSASKFDVKCLARKLSKTKEVVEPKERDFDPERIGLEDLNESFLKMYSDLHKHESINIREVDFGSFDVYDLDDFYTFLETYDHRMFNFGEAMLSFIPATVSKPVFI